MAMSNITFLYSTLPSNKPTSCSFNLCASKRSTSSAKYSSTTSPLNMQPSHGQFCCIMISAFKFSNSSLHLLKLQRTQTMEKLHSVSIWEPGIARNFVARKPTFGNRHAFSFHHSKGATSGFIGIANLRNKENSDTSNPIPTSFVVMRASNK